MSLYDDMEFPSTPITKIDENAGASKKLNLSFLKSQLEAKKALLQNRQTISSSATPTAVVNLNSSEAPANTQNKPRSLLNLKPRKAIPFPVDSTSTFTIVPKALKEDKVFLFGEITIEDEYNPTAPTDYASFKPKREAQLVKEKIAKEIADRLSQQHNDEEEKRKSGAAIAPPQTLLEQDTNSTTSTPEVFELPPQFDKKSTTRGLGVAANIMSKLGYRQGFGLGRDQQGMSTPLRVERTGKNAGLIISEKNEKPEIMEIDEENSSPKPETDQKSITEMLKSSSKIVMLKNMVLATDVDERLEVEVKEEMKKYGQIKSVNVHVMENLPSDESVRIFLEFTNIAQAIKAVVDLNGRFFGGRAIRPSFYPFDDFVNRKFDS